MGRTQKTARRYILPSTRPGFLLPYSLPLPPLAAAAAAAVAVVVVVAAAVSVSVQRRRCRVRCHSRIWRPGERYSSPWLGPPLS